MAKFKLDTTDAVIIGAAGLVLTFLYYVEQQKQSMQAAATKTHTTTKTRHHKGA